MAIHYDFYPAKGLKGAKDQLFVRPISNKTTSTDELMRDIERATTATRGDIRLVLSALSRSVISELLAGNRVHLDGFGYFSLSMDGDIVRDKNGKPQLRNAAVRNVLFQPERAMMGMLGGARFTAADHRGRRSSQLSDDKLQAALRELGEEGRLFSSAQFRKKLGLTISTASRILRRLRNEGILENVGTKNSLMLRLK